ncbi:MAG: hypothetical protein DRJ61_11490 [Acidobacteria bacterium]|nr:MAG: hypothetical protein DRJ61_11490 [Acidobacteriota bacterium]
MSKGSSIALVVMSVFVVALGGCSKQPELLVGGGFESQSEFQKTPGDWYPTVLPRTKEFVDFAWDDQVAYTGKRSVSIAIDPSHPDEKIAYNWTNAVPGCEEGKTYELSGWIKAEDLNGPAWICIQSWDDTKSKMLGFETTQMDYPVTGTTDWTRVGTVFKVPVGTAEVRIRAGIATPENRGGRVWFDDLSVRSLD